MKRSICLLLAVVFVSLFNGCEGPAGPNLKGDIIGYAVLIDNNDNYLKDNSEIIVSIDGTFISTITSSDGRFVLSNVNTGTYSISFSKAGYGTMKIVSYPFVGGGQAYLDHVYLCQIPTYTVTDLSAAISSSGITVSGKINGASSIYRRAALFFSTSTNVSSNPQNYSSYFPIYMYNSDSAFTQNLYNIFTSNNFHSGQTIYLIAYAGPDIQYLDLASGKTIFPSLNPTPSNVVSVVVP